MHTSYLGGKIAFQKSVYFFFKDLGWILIKCLFFKDLNVKDVILVNVQGKQQKYLKLVSKIFNLHITIIRNELTVSINNFFATSSLVTHPFIYQEQPKALKVETYVIIYYNL